jgi:hypothetical protein
MTSCHITFGKYVFCQNMFWDTHILCFWSICFWWPKNRIYYSIIWTGQNVFWPRHELRFLGARIMVKTQHMFFGVNTFRYKHRFLVFWYKRFGQIPIFYHFIQNVLDKTHMSCVLSKRFLTKHELRFLNLLRFWQNTNFLCFGENVFD